MRMVFSIVFLFLSLASSTVISAQERESLLIVSNYSPAKKGDVVVLQELIAQSCSFYISQHLKKEESTLKWDRPVGTIKKELEAIVRYSVKYYHFKELSSFKGFSEQVKESITGLQNLTFSDSTILKKGQTESDIKKSEYIFFQKRIQELELLIDVEIGNFSNDNLFSPQATTFYEGVNSDSLMSWIEYHEGATLDSKEIQLNPASELLLSKEDESHLDARPLNTHADSFSEELIRLVEYNNRQLDDMRSKMDQLLQGQLALMEARQNETNQLLQAQINDLRSMVIELVGINKGGAVADAGNIPGKIDLEELNLPSEIEIYFEKNKTSLNEASQLVLNEVVDILVRNPSLNALVTGLADKSGDPTANLELSRKRAAAVKNFVSSAGVASERLVTKYIGDTDSNGESATERKVIIEFIDYR